MLSPLDVIPDFIPLAGFIDDAAVFGFVLAFAKDDLVRYREWRKMQQNTMDVK